MDKLLRTRGEKAGGCRRTRLWLMLPFSAPDSSPAIPQRGILCTNESALANDPPKPFQRKRFPEGAENGKCGEKLWMGSLSRNPGRHNNESPLIIV